MKREHSTCRTGPETDPPKREDGSLVGLFNQGRRRLLCGVAGLGVWGRKSVAAAAPSEIVLGQSLAAGRPELALISRVQQAYFEQVNALGGIRGRPVRLVSLDDGGDSAVACQNLRKLASSHRAVALLSFVGSGLAHSDTLPQLFVRDRLSPDASKGAVRVGFYPNYSMEGAIFGKYIASRRPAARTAVIQGLDAAGRQLADGFRNSFDDRAEGGVVSSQTIAQSDAQIASQLRVAQSSGAKVLLVAASPVSTSKVLRILSGIRWSPQSLVGSDAAQALCTMMPELGALASGVQSVRYLKDGHDPAWSTLKRYSFVEFPRWDNDRGIQAYTVFLRRYVPGSDSKTELVEYAYSAAQLMECLLAQCGDRVDSGNVGRQALKLGGSGLALLSPGIRVYTNPERTAPITQGQITRFDGGAWTEFGDVVEADDA